MKIIHQQGWLKQGQKGMVWLGQAGFWINTGRHKILIDPYLSDSLAKKYEGEIYDHQRMVDIPIGPTDLPKPDLVLISHAHTDHMDGETLAPLAQKYPDLPFFVPQASMDIAKERIGVDTYLIGLNADQTYNFDNYLNIRTFPAAHESLETDDYGHHLFLGYGIEDAGLRIYHSGDCIPYDGLKERVDAFAAHIALMATNGRDEQRLKANIAGNFTLEEAYELSQNAQIFIPHHWGMFAFNTIAKEKIMAFAQKNTTPPIILPQHGNSLVIE